MLKKLLLGLVALIALFLIVVATRPGAFRIERSAQINAPAEVVFAQVNDFRHWDGWSPWARLDPNMTKTIAGAPQGVGSTYAWSGNTQVGEGRMTIIESKPNETVGIKLEFLKPWQATNRATFLFDSKGPATKVTWVMEGTNNFMGKAVALFMDMDAVIGKEFEKGLAQMKTVAEAQHQDGVATRRGQRLDHARMTRDVDAQPKGDTTMQVNPYLTFNGQCEAAFKFYERCFGGKIEMMLTHGESPIADQVPAEWHKTIMHARLVVGDKILMGSDAPPDRYERPQGLSVSLGLDEPAEAERIFQALAEHGTVRMALQQTFWALRFGMLVDRFGIPWMINCEGAA